jgi:carboxyl-terminal processing protease
VKLLSLLLLLCVATPAGAEPFSPGQTFDQPLVAQVTANALAFIVPRTLEPVSARQLALWGLRGLPTLDPRLALALSGNQVQVLEEGRLLLGLSSPLPDDTSGWGETMAALARAGWDASHLVREAGTGGVLTALFDSMCSHLDPYSRYLPPARALADEERRGGEASLGITLARRGEEFIVRALAPAGPAAMSGIEVGDRLLAVDGSALRHLHLAQANALLAGPADTTVLLRLRQRDGQRRDVVLTRMLVPPQTVRAQRLGPLLLLQVSGFASDTGARLAFEIVHGLAAAPPPRGIVLDLRDNRGGLLLQAVAAADTLIPAGVVARTVGRDAAADHDFRADGVDLAHGLPVVVLVNNGSASAAEILAAALADQGRAVVVGSSTFGKGLVQTIDPLPDGGELLVTWSRVLAPDGWPLQGLGVLPQVCTSLGPTALRQQLDALAHGYSLLAPALRRSRAARAPLPAAEIDQLRSTCPPASGHQGALAAARTLILSPAAYAAALLTPAR